MADIKIKALLSPLPVQGVTAGAVSGNATGRLASVLANLLPGTIISGFVLNRDTKGNPILRTEQGDLLIETDLFLKIGSDVTARIEKHGNKTSARILTVDTLPPDVAQSRHLTDQPDIVGRDPAQLLRNPQASPTGQTLPAEAELPTTPVQPRTTQGTAGNAPATTAANAASTTRLNTPRAPLLEAIVLGPSSNAGNPQNETAQNLPAGTQLGVRIIAAQTTYERPATPVPQTNNAQPQSPTSATPQSTVVITATETRPPAATQTTANAAITQNSTTPTDSNAQSTTKALPATAASAYAAYGKPNLLTPAQNAASPQATSATTTNAPAAPPPPQPPLQAGSAIPSQIQATIIASEPDGTLIAQSPVGLLKLPILAKMSAGGTIQLAVVSATPPSSANAIGGVNLAPPASLQLSQSWHSLQEIVHVMLQEAFSGKEALNALQERIPWVGLAGAQSASTGAGVSANAQNISSPLLFFMSALAGGNLRSWLGENTTKFLEDNGHTPLLDQADGEFSQLATLARTTSQQGWQSTFFPVMTGEQIQMARLFVRRDRKENESHADSEDTRFVVEVELSELGELQLDGLVRKASGNRIVFDLSIKSATPLTPQMQQEIIAIYDSAGELTGYGGTLLFQQTPGAPESPMQDLLKPWQDETPDILA